MNKLRLAYSTTTCLHEILEGEFNIVHKPFFKFNGTSLENNFDFFLMIDGDEIPKKMRDYINFLNIPILGINRHHKSNQSLILKQNGLNTPMTYFLNEKINGFNIINLLSNITDKHEQLVVKMQTGARGLGQCLIKKQLLIDFLNEDPKMYDEIKEMARAGSLKMQEEPESCFKKYETETKKEGSNSFKSKEINEGLKSFDKYKKSIKTGNGGWKDDNLINTLYNGDFIVQKFVEVSEEYRLLYFYNQEPIVIERKLNDTGWQANSCITGYRKEVKKYFIPTEIYDKIDKMAIKLKIPFLSLDVYKDKDDNWGVFEFQSEFGFQEIESNKLYEKLNGSVKEMYLYFKNLEK